MGLGGFGMGEMVFIFLIVLLLFGAKRLPEIGSSLGKGIREFKSSVKDIERELTLPEDEQRKIHRSNTPPSSEPKDAAGGSQSTDGEPRKLSDGIASSATSASTDE